MMLERKLNIIEFIQQQAATVFWYITVGWNYRRLFKPPCEPFIVLAQFGPNYDFLDTYFDPLKPKRVVEYWMLTEFHVT